MSLRAFARRRAVYLGCACLPELTSSRELPQFVT